jgi:hypothetical protein
MARPPNIRQVGLRGFLFLTTAACSYESIRTNQRQKCSAMPQSQSESCYSRTRMTKEEYDTERKKSAASRSSGEQEKKPVDPRYKDWLP